LEKQLKEQVFFFVPQLRFTGMEGNQLVCSSSNDDANDDDDDDDDDDDAFIITFTTLGNISHNITLRL
jgi:hypothetical protein